MPKKRLSPSKNKRCKKWKAANFEKRIGQETAYLLQNLEKIPFKAYQSMIESGTIESIRNVKKECDIYFSEQHDGIVYKGEYFVVFNIIKKNFEAVGRFKESK